MSLGNVVESCGHASCWVELRSKSAVCFDGAAGERLCVLGCSAARRATAWEVVSRRLRMSVS